MSMFATLHRQIGALSGTQIFFIGGSMKSGTTWLQLLLDAHPQILCKGESHVANHLATGLLRCLDAHNRKIEQKNRTVFSELDGFPLYTADDLAYLVGTALLMPFARDGSAAVCAVGEKTPDNVRYFDVLRAIFPAAKFLHVVRDGRDCAVSAWFHNLRTNPAWVQSKFASMAEYATMFAREWAADIAHAERFAAANPGAMLTVRYEALLDGAPSVLRDVLSFLDVPADAPTIAQCCDAARFERLSAGRAQGSEDRASFFRNGTHGNWRAHFDTATTDLFFEAAAPWLQRLGYG